MSKDLTEQVQQRGERWFWIFIAILLWTAFVNLNGYVKGYRAGINHVNRENGYVLGKLTEMGFCRWVDTQFKPHCDAEAGRSSLKEKQP